MISTIKWIVAALVLAGALALFIWGDRIQPGSILAGVAGFFAMLKSRLFGRRPLVEQIEEISRLHAQKREGWEVEKQQYEDRYRNLKEKIDSLDRRTDILRQKLDEAGNPGYTPKQISQEELLKWLKSN